MTLALMLNMLEPFNLRSRGRWSAETMHLMIECMRRAYAERAKYLGDPDFVPIPADLTTKSYAQQLAGSIDMQRASPSAAFGPMLTPGPEGMHTTHFSIVDATAMAVANTYTIEEPYGSGVVVTGAGFLLNNEMGDFNPRPGVTDRHGTIGSPPNEIAPQKRMLSSMSPTVVAKDGKAYLVTGSPGGRSIINTVLNVLVNVLEFDMDLRAALDAPRLDHQWFPETVEFESAEAPQYASAVARLRAMGHEVSAGGRSGDANSILVRRGLIVGAADDRTSAAVAPRLWTRSAP